MSTSKLFTPVTVGAVQLQHRIAMAPLTRFRADKANVPLPMVAEYYAQRGSVPGTLLIAEATQVSSQHAGGGQMPGVWSHDQIESWKRVTRAVHEKDSKIFLQLIALGKAAQPDEMRAKGLPYLSSSAVPMKEGGEKPIAMSEDQIEQAIEDFVQAAKNAIEAGFDGIEIHGANGYLVDQFTQDTANKRTDRWGGSVENRSRFGLEIAKRIAEAIGKDRVGYRISPWSTFQAMGMDDPRAQFAHLSKSLKELDIAYLHIIESRITGNADTDSEEPLDFVLNEWGTEKPVFLAGGFHPDTATNDFNGKYSKYNAVMVFGRHFISNPDLPYRIENGIDLTKYDRSTFYTPFESKGYTDYSFSSQFLKEVQAKA